MGTYLIFDSKKTKICGHKIRVTPYPTPDPSISLFPIQGFQASGQKGRDPETPSPNLESNMPTPHRQPGSTTTPPGCLQVRTIITPASVQARTTTPQGSLESRTATLSPAFQRGPGASSLPTAAAPAVVVGSQRNHQ